MDLSGADLSRPAAGVAEPRRIAERIAAARPDAIHIATEGPIGYRRALLLPKQRPAVHDQLYDAISRIHFGPLPIPQRLDLHALRRFHAAAAVTMVATPSLMTELAERGFANLGMWTRGVDVDLFRPDRAIDLDFPRPIFMTVGRVAVEKNLPAFLSLDLPGSKVVIGAGPQEA